MARRAFGLDGTAPLPVVCTVCTIGPPDDGPPCRPVVRGGRAGGHASSLTMDNNRGAVWPTPTRAYGHGLIYWR